jgi:hypothetical protein
MPETRFDKGCVKNCKHIKMTTFWRVLQLPLKYDSFPRNGSQCGCCWPPTPRENSSDGHAGVWNSQTHMGCG